MSKNKNPILVAIFCTVFAQYGCANFNDEGAPSSSVKCTGVTTFQTFKEKLANTCLTCHGATTLAAGKDYTNYATAFSAITPNSPETSILYTKVVSGTMKDKPSETAARDAAAVIKCWILSGGVEQ